MCGAGTKLRQSPCLEGYYKIDGLVSFEDPVMDLGGRELCCCWENGRASVHVRSHQNGRGNGGVRVGLLWLAPSVIDKPTMTESSTAFGKS